MCAAATERRSVSSLSPCRPLSAVGRNFEKVKNVKADTRSGDEAERISVKPSSLIGAGVVVPRT